MITKTCAVSGKTFEIDVKDQVFYDKMEVPTPTLCPEERERRRWAWRGKNFSIRKCCECGGNAMSYFAPEANKIETLCEKCFHADGFDGMEYGRDFDFSMANFRLVKK